MALSFWGDFCLRKGLQFPRDPPQDEVCSSSRVGSPKHTGLPHSALAQTQQQEETGSTPGPVCCRIKAPGWEAASAGAAEEIDPGALAGERVPRLRPGPGGTWTRAVGGAQPRGRRPERGPLRSHVAGVGGGPATREEAGLFLTSWRGAQTTPHIPARTFP